MKTTIKHITSTLLAAAAIGGMLPKAPACVRIFLNNDPQQLISARNWDLYMDDNARIVYFPRGIERKGGADSNATQWASKYASVAALSFNVGSSEALNEKGLGAGLLYLDGTIYEPADSRPTISNIALIQYVVDNFGTVADALQGLAKLRVTSGSAGGREWPLHLVIDDTTGDSAIIEFVKGKPVILHGKQYNVLSNEPSMDIQLANLKKYKLFGGDLAMPGDIDPQSRFVRAASYLKTVPKPANSDEATGYVTSVLRSVMVPFGAEDTNNSATEDKWPTRWSTISDHNRRRFYFLSSLTQNIFWVDLDNLVSSTDMLAILPNASLHGEISGQMTKFTPGQHE